MYTIERQEVKKNNEGLDEMFVGLQIVDDLGVYNHGFWIYPAKYQEYLQNPSILTTIIDTQVIKAKAIYQASLNQSNG